MNTPTFTASLARERIKQLCLAEGDDFVVLFHESENIVPGRQTRFPKSISATLREPFLDEDAGELLVMQKGETLRLPFAEVRNIFRHPPLILPIPMTDNYRLLDTYIFKYQDSEGDKYRIIIPESFPYDGNSVPRWLISLSGVERDGAMRIAALVHDWIYVNGGRIGGDYISLEKYENGAWVRIEKGQSSRFDADRLYGLILRDALVSKRMRRRMFSAVYYNGWLVWKDEADRKRGLLGNIGLSAKGFLKLIGTVFIPKDEV